MKLGDGDFLAPLNMLIELRRMLIGENPPGWAAAVSSAREAGAFSLSEGSYSFRLRNLSIRLLTGTQ